MAVLTMKAEARPDKYGVVVVRNADRSFNREFKITGQELATLHASGNGWPPGVTQSDWESGLAACFGKEFEVGDVAVRSGGQVRMKIAERVVNGRFVESYLDLEPGEYTGTIPNITVDSAKLTAIRSGPPSQKRQLPGVVVDRISNGAVTWR